MRHNCHWGLGFYSPYIMTITVLIIALIIYLASKHKAAPPNKYFIKILDSLKVKYAEGFITYDDYVKRKVVIEEYEYLNPYSLILLERYAKCEIDIKELFKLKIVIENEDIDSSIRENLSKGLLSYNNSETPPIPSSTTLNPEEIKVYMTIEEVSTALKIDIKKLYTKLDIPSTVPKETKLKDVKNFVPDFEVEKARESLK